MGGGLPVSEYHPIVPRAALPPETVICNYLILLYKLYDYGIFLDRGL